MNVLITIESGIGVNVGPNVSVYSNIGSLTYTVTVSELLAGVELTFEDSASYIYLESLGTCLNTTALIIDYCTTSTTTSSSSTTTTSTSTLTTTSTTTISCASGYSYNVSFYNCESCDAAGSGTICNEYPLSIGKWYYDPFTNKIIHINSFVECTCDYSDYHILDQTKRNSCAEVSCCVNSYLYQVGYYDCYTCEYLDSGYICNENLLTIGKWYLDPLTGNSLHIVGFEECGCGTATHNILDESKFNECNEVPCISTTTTSTTFICDLSPTVDEIDYYTTTTTTTTLSYEQINYGYLYNWYAATDVRNIANADWRVPSKSDYETLQTYLGDYNSAGQAMSEPNLAYWISITNYNNSSGFYGRGAGRRMPWGAFEELKITLFLADTQPAGGAGGTGTNTLNGGQFFLNTAGKTANQGNSIRLIKNSTTLTHGQTGTYTGNDGKVYRTICIGTQEWLADNLIETKYRNGNWIPGYDSGVYTPIDNATWASLTTGAMCVYNDDESYK